MNQLTAIILTKDEESHIAGCLESLSWVDRVVVLDSYSNDRTVELARSLGAAVLQHPFKNFADQRNAALDRVESDWVLFVDADERVPAELAQEVKLAVANSAYDGWWIPRKSYCFGRWLEHGGFYPDFQLRLARRDRITYDAKKKVHERAILDGRAGYLRHPLLHMWCQTLREAKETLSRYASISAEMRYEEGVRSSYRLVAAPVHTFFRRYLLQQGYRDGRVGLLMSLLWSYYAFDEYRRLWVLWKSSRPHKS